MGVLKVEGWDLEPGQELKWVPSEVCLPQREKMEKIQAGPPPGYHSRKRVQKGPQGKDHGLFVSVTLKTEASTQEVLDRYLWNA